MGTSVIIGPLRVWSLIALPTLWGARSPSPWGRIRSEIGSRPSVSILRRSPNFCVGAALEARHNPRQPVTGNRRGTRHALRVRVGGTEPIMSSGPTSPVGVRSLGVLGELTEDLHNHDLSVFTGSSPVRVGADRLIRVGWHSEPVSSDHPTTVRSVASVPPRQ